ncbi:MAG: GNAT family N-acetyltransferase [Caulobacter sp.]|nr:GNAT family N-acetyltransferase [Caulobacter sp.]
MIIETERLRLRPARPEDAEALHGVFADPIAMAYWSTTPHESLEQTREWVAAMIAGDGSGSGLDLVVEYEGRAIGKAGFWKPPEIGYILHPDHWGRGLAREALAAVIRAGFADLGLERVIADVDPRNSASLRLLERLGFSRTGHGERTWHIGGRWCDSVYLTLTRSDAAALNSTGV